MGGFENAEKETFFCEASLQLRTFRGEKKQEESEPQKITIFESTIITMIWSG
jgi:hypothetical protein